MKILLINGPNLNLLGLREPDIYGSQSLSELESSIKDNAARLNIELECFQSNHEGFLIDKIHEAKSKSVNYIIINPGAYGHTSIALRDALVGVSIPFVEVHISNTFSREEFRKFSYLSEKAISVILGCGTKGYELALDFLSSKNN